MLIFFVMTINKITESIYHLAKPYDFRQDSNEIQRIKIKINI